MDQLVSVIIPVYNVAQYLDECVESVVGQTYGNLEIILVDDGSTDGSGDMCDEWRERDARIKVIHKSNGGLSSARNAGLEIAAGEYIGFVDSDDYIDKDMYGKLIEGFGRGENIVITSNVPMAVKGTEIAPIRKDWDIDKEKLYGSGNFFTCMLDTDFCITVWSKLFKRSLIRHIRFKEGRNNEDTLFLFEISKLIEQNNLYMLYMPNKSYYYRQREGSICHSEHTPLFLDELKNVEDMIDYFVKRGDKDKLLFTKRHYIKRVTATTIEILSNRKWTQKYLPQRKQTLANITVQEAVSLIGGHPKLLAKFLALKYLPNVCRLYLMKRRQV